jgi:uncharacterized membrane protein (DUF2068 family)
MVSASFESFANIWSFEGGIGAIQSSLNLQKTSEIMSNLHGKFNNYKHLIKMAKFINNSPFCLALDEVNICKIFNF